jgi:hypothetical protein
MAYNKIRYFKTKTLPSGKFANALRSALSRYTLNPESAHLDLVMHFADNSGQRYEYAMFDNLQTICDLGSDFGLTMRFMAEFKISDSATFMDNIYIHFRGMKVGHVIGTRRAIDDKAAIAFAVGFYQALGAGRTIEDAYKLGCV